MPGTNGDLGAHFAEGAVRGGLGGSAGTTFGEWWWPPRTPPRFLAPGFGGRRGLPIENKKERNNYPFELYHVTPGRFDRIDAKKAGSTTGENRGDAPSFYMQPNARVAEQYAEWQYRQGRSPEIMPMRVRFNNPLVVEGLPIPFPVAFPRGRLASQWKRLASDEGHDGVIFKNVLDSPLGYKPIPTDVYQALPQGDPPRHLNIRNARARFNPRKRNSDDLNAFEAPAT